MSVTRPVVRRHLRRRVHRAHRSASPFALHADRARPTLQAEGFGLAGRRRDVDVHRVRQLHRSEIHPVLRARQHPPPPPFRGEASAAPATISGRGMRSKAIAEVVAAHHSRRGSTSRRTRIAKPAVVICRRAVCGGRRGAHALVVDFCSSADVRSAPRAPSAPGGLPWYTPSPARMHAAPHAEGRPLTSPGVARGCCGPRGTPLVAPAAPAPLASKIASSAGFGYCACGKPRQLVARARRCRVSRARRAPGRPCANPAHSCVFQLTLCSPKLCALTGSRSRAPARRSTGGHRLGYAFTLNVESVVPVHRARLPCHVKQMTPLCVVERPVRVGRRVCLVAFQPAKRRHRSAQSAASLHQRQ